MKEPFDISSRPSLIFSVRFLLAVLMFFGIAFQYMQRINMGIGIIVMVNSTAIQQDEPGPSPIIDQNDTCLFHPGAKNSTHDGKFVWSKSVQGLILSSYFYGYILTQIPGGWLATKYGAKRVFGLGMLGGSIMTILVVPSAELSYGALLACRFLNGLFHGLMFPSMSAIFVKWVPPFEKSRIIGFSASGSNIGNVIALPLGGFLCSLDNCWKLMFYIFGGIGLVWLVFFLLLTADSPDKHRFISDKERQFVMYHSMDSMSDLTDEDENVQVNSSQNKSELKVPWKSIFTSKACYACFVAHLCHNWGIYMFLTQLPTFMKEILRFDIKSNGLFSSIPYISCWLCTIISSIISDRLILNETISKESIRKLFNGLGFIIPMTAVILLSFVSCAHPYTGVVLLAIGVGFLGLNMGAGFQVNINEIGGVYSGVLFGISNCFATISGIVAPYIVGVMTTNGTQEEWQRVFFLTAGIYLFGAIVYVSLSKAKPEKWALHQNIN